LSLISLPAARHFAASRIRFPSIGHRRFTVH
jgi:hypothetical protein